MLTTRKIASTNNINRNDTLITCPFMRALAMIEGRWKLVIICHLRDFGNQSFSQLLGLMPKASRRMLAKALKELAGDKIIEKKVFDTFPQTVEYSLTQHGLKLLPVIENLKDWGLKVKPELELIP